MKGIWKALISFFVLMMVFTGAIAETADSASAEQSGEKKVLVIETTDVHGYIMDASSGKEDTFQYRLAYMAYLFDAARTSGEYDDVLLLDGGDLYQGPPISNLTGGATIRAAFDVMKYDAVALGNHEFDWDVTEYAADQDGTIAPYVLGDYFGDPKTPVLASNLYDAKTGERVPFTRDYTVVERAGLKIAIVGYIEDYSDTIMHEKIVPYSIDPDTDKLNALVRKIRDEEHPDAVIVLAHADPEPLAEAVDPTLVNLVAGGHTHQIAADFAGNGVPYIQGNHYGYGFASAVLRIAANDEIKVDEVQYTSITDDKALLYDTEENEAHLNSDIMDVSRVTWAVVKKEMSEVLGYTDTPVMNMGEGVATGAGNWITGMMLQGMQSEGVLAAFYNTWGIRASLEIPEGQTTREVTVNDIFTLTPFGDKLLMFDITGKELATHLEKALHHSDYGDQMSGLRFTYTATGNPESPREKRDYTVKSITFDDGTEVDINDTEKLYRVCITDFCASIPGSVFEGKEPVNQPADAPIETDVFFSLLREAREKDGGRISVDTSEKGIEVTE